jgi:hypothetical protein
MNKKTDNTILPINYPSTSRVLDALESMAIQYLQIKDKDGSIRYDHAFMSAGEECLEVLIDAERIPEWMDYRTGMCEPPVNNMSKEDYNSGLDTAASIVEEVIGGTSEGETILCGIESSKKNINK